MGLACLYVPTLITLFRGVWAQDEQMHGPVVLCVGLWLIRHNWAAMEKAAQTGRPSAWGWPVLVVAMLLYLVGRSQDVLVFQVGSFVWVLIAVLLLLRGSSALEAQWFSVFFLLFMVPLPAVIVDAVTMPMKMAVSHAAEHILYWAGYPIGRTGVMLRIGQYMLLVADACAGLHTLLTLEALGLLYLKLVQRDSWVRNIGLAVLIAPISFAANVIRVIALCLITYHFGDAAGQGFLHGFAGMVLFLSALLLILLVDKTLQGFEARQRHHRYALAAVGH